MLGLSSWCRMTIVLIFATACEREAEPSLLSEPLADTALSPARLGVPSAALEAVVEARCARAQRCSRIGAGREHASFYDCAVRVRAEWADELNRVVCERGVDEGALQRCLRALSERGCDGEVPADACWPFELCDRPPQPFPAPPARDGAVPG
jgi:hypothetical protein